MNKENDNSCGYVLKVPSFITKKLIDILKSANHILKLDELSSIFDSKYNCKLYIYSTANRELFLEVYPYTSNLNEDLDVSCSEEDLLELQNCMKKVDFTDESRSNGSYSFSSSGSDTKKYVQINLEDTESGFGDYDDLVNFFDVRDWKINELLRVFIANIYDPSKIWIRFAPVDTFQRLLWEFYNGNEENFLIKPNEISVGQNCVVLISDLYYRGRIVRTDIQDSTTFKVFLYDFGKVQKVKCSKIFYLHSDFCEVPVFTVRCMLTNISSLDNEMWSHTVVDRLSELVQNKQLVAKISHIHVHRKILEIDLFDIDLRVNDKIPSINYRLVSEKMAKISWHDPIVKEHDQFKRLKKYLYHYPTFEMIENGITPSQASLVEKLKTCVPWDMAFPELYRYEVSN